MNRCYFTPKVQDILNTTRSKPDASFGYSRICDQGEPIVGKTLWYVPRPLPNTLIKANSLYKGPRT